MRKLLLLACAVVILGGCAGCDLSSLFRGPVYKTEIESVTPFTMSDDLVFIPTCLMADLGKKDKVFAVDARAETKVGEVTLKTGTYNLPSDGAVAVANHLWVEGGSGSGIAYQMQIFVVDPAAAKVEKTIGYKEGFEWNMSYLKANGLVTMEHGTNYGQSYIDKYGGDNPVTLFSPTAESYIGEAWGMAMVHYLTEAPDGTIWGINGFATDQAQLGIFSFSGNKLSFTSKAGPEDYPGAGGAISWNRSGFAITADGDVLIDRGNMPTSLGGFLGIYPDYCKGQSYDLLPQIAGVSASDVYTRNVQYSPETGRVFVTVEAPATSGDSGNYIWVVEKGTDGKWAWRTDLSLSYSGGAEMIVHSGHVLLYRSATSTTPNTVDFYSTATLQKEKTLVLDDN